MWRVILSFVTTRIILFAVALLALNSSLPSENPKMPLVKIHSFASLVRAFEAKVAQGVEHGRLMEAMRVPLKNVYQVSKDPYIWAARWLAGLTDLSEVKVLLLLSNIFLLLFLNELY